MGALRWYRTVLSVAEILPKNTNKTSDPIHQHQMRTGVNFTRSRVPVVELCPINKHHCLREVKNLLFKKMQFKKSSVNLVISTMVCRRLRALECSKREWVFRSCMRTFQ